MVSLTLGSAERSLYIYKGSIISFLFKAAKKHIIYSAKKIARK